MVILGFCRNEAAPWGGPARLGTRVLRRFVESYLKNRTDVKHELTVVDPLELDLEILRKPHFYYKQGEAPEKVYHWGW